MVRHDGKKSRKEQGKPLEINEKVVAKLSTSENFQHLWSADMEERYLKMEKLISLLDMTFVTKLSNRKTKRLKANIHTK